jgi:hypothetical protein
MCQLIDDVPLRLRARRLAAGIRARTAERRPIAPMFCVRVRRRRAPAPAERDERAEQLGFHPGASSTRDDARARRRRDWDSVDAGRARGGTGARGRARAVLQRGSRQSLSPHEPARALRWRRMECATTRGREGGASAGHGARRFARALPSISCARIRCGRAAARAWRPAGSAQSVYFVVTIDQPSRADRRSSSNSWSSLHARSGARRTHGRRGEARSAYVAGADRRSLRAAQRGQEGARVCVPKLRVSDQGSESHIVTYI